MVWQSFFEICQPVYLKRRSGSFFSVKWRLVAIEKTCSLFRISRLVMTNSKACLQWHFWYNIDFGINYARNYFRYTTSSTVLWKIEHSLQLLRTLLLGCLLKNSLVLINRTSVQLPSNYFFYLINCWIVPLHSSMQLSYSYDWAIEL